MKETPEHYPTPEESIATMVTIDDTALVFEGDGMRNAYTAALVSRLIAEGINFPHISGVSAGSSHLCNFTSRDAQRSHDTFVDLVEDPEFGGLKHFRKGHGYLRPLELQQAADALGVSKEWIRCAVKDKYLQCPQGIYPMSWFFTRESMSDE